MRFLRKRREVRYQGIPLPQKIQQNLEAQREESQGDGQRHSLQSVCLHTLPAFRQGYARCLIFFKEKNQTGEIPGFFLYTIGKLEFVGLDALQIPVASSQWSVVSIG